MDRNSESATLNLKQEEVKEVKEVRDSDKMISGGVKEFLQTKYEEFTDKADNALSETEKAVMYTI